MDKRGGEKSGLLPFASGKLVDDYSILREYWKRARAHDREDLVEKSMLTEEDYNLVRNIVSSKGRVGLQDLWDEVAERLAERIDPDIAQEALEAHGIRTTKDTARRLVARQLAAWLIEAAEYWRMIRFSEDRSKKESGQDEPSQ